MDGREENFEIILEDSFNRNTIEETVNAAGDAIRYPLYINCYKEALNAIIENSYTYEREFNRKDYCSDYCGNEFDNDYNFNKVNNIIAFLGERGSGKTTVVNEFCHILHSLNRVNFREIKNTWMKSLQQSEAVRKLKDEALDFTILKPIDASVLEEKENIVELIWADMYELFEKEAGNNSRGMAEAEKRKIIREFDEVYKNHSKICHSEIKDNLGESVLVKLKNMPSSFKTRETFSKLLTDYFNLVNPEKHIKKYLVVTIDDLDLNIKHGYDMLEQIHKYLSHPQIIVLLAVDFEQISFICENYFIKKMMVKNEECDERIVRHAKQLSNDYMLKILPVSNRVYLPDKDLILKNAFVRSNGREQKVKDYILNKFAERTGIYYDGTGLKKHFCVPGTVRELVTYKDFLNTLFVIDWKNDGEKTESSSDSEKMMLWYDQNFRRVNKDINERMAYQVLKPVQRARFRLILERNIERRAQYTVYFCEQWSKDSQESALKDYVDDRSYCYLDLLKCLYDYGRNRYEDKALVHCLLASFTSEMTWQYYNYLHNSDEAEREKSRRCLLGFVGETFGGKWLNEVIPIVKRKEDDVIYDACYIKNIELKVLKIEYQLAEGQTIISSQRPLDKKFDLLIAEIEKKEALKTLMGVLAFLNGFKDDSGEVFIPDIEFNIEEGEIEKGKITTLSISLKAHYANFDILAFMAKPDNLKAWYQTIYKKIRTGLAAGLGKALNTNLDAGRNIKIERLISVQMKKPENTKEAIFPFYNLDLSYNVLKRVIRTCKKKISRTIEAANFCDSIRKIYGYIAEELLAEDWFYNQEKFADNSNGEERYRIKKGKSGSTSFAYNFVSSWFIQFFGIQYPDGPVKLNNEQIGGRLPSDFNEKLIAILGASKVESKKDGASDSVE